MGSSLFPPFFLGDSLIGYGVFLCVFIFSFFFPRFGPGKEKSQAVKSSCSFAMLDSYCCPFTETSMLLEQSLLSNRVLIVYQFKININ